MRSLIVGTAAVAAVAAAQPAQALPTVSAHLTITVGRFADDPDPQMWTLTCDPVEGRSNGGDHPLVEDLCAQSSDWWTKRLIPNSVRKNGSERHFGTEVAEITGTLNGQKVDAKFSRVNAVYNHLWEEAKMLLEPMGSVADI